MFVDSLLQLSDAQALTATGYSTNTIDLGDVTPKRDIGNGEALELVVSVDVAADGTTTDETYEFQVVQSANANLSSHDSLVERVVGYANLTAGKVVRIPIAAGAVTKRYLGARYILGGTTPSITVTAFVQPASMASLEKPTAYADAITIG
jgi:hypothetical protein